MKLLLKDEYEKLDSYMTDLNIGGRQGRQIQDHLFIVNGIFFKFKFQEEKAHFDLYL